MTPTWTSAFFKNITLLLLVAFYLCATPADAKKKNSVPVRKVGYSVKNKELKISFRFADIFSTKVENRLKSGLATKIHLQIILENSDKKQIQSWFQSINIVYDLWEENFLVTITNSNGKRTARLNTLEDIVKAAAVLHHTAIATNIPADTYRLNVKIVANPVSKKMVHNIQRWISRPSSGIATGRNTTNYFGSFVGFFVDRNIGKADKTVTFVSQWFTP